MKKSIKWLAVSFILCFILGCGSENNNAKEPEKEIELALNWFPEAEHGGFYEALVNKHYEKENLKVKILAGGPGVPVLQQVATSRVAYGVVNADDVLNAVASGADVVAIYAPMQTNPRCIMVHEESGIEKISDIKNMTLAMSARPSFRHWLTAKNKFEGVKIVPYPPNIMVFLKDKKFAQQAYNIAEPFTARSKGAKPKVLMLSDLGFNPYASVLITTNKRIREKPEEVKAMIKASITGWENYIKEPTKTNAHIHSLNEGMTLDILKFGAEELKALVKPIDKNVPANGMIYERWKILADQLKEAKLVDLTEKQIRSAFHADI